MFSIHSTGTTSEPVISQQAHSYAHMDHYHASIASLLEKCKNEPDLDKRIEMLYAINAILPKSRRLKIPSFITNDYVYQALYRIEEMLLVA